MPTKNNIKITGFTLIELIIGMTLSSLIILFLITIYLALIKNQNSQIALSTVKENGEMLTPLILSAIHGAGYIGCARLTHDFPVINKTNYAFNADNKILVSDNMLVTRQASFNMGMLSKDMANQSILYAITNTENFSQGDVLLISDCKTMDIFTAKNILPLVNGSQRIISEFPLSKLYPSNSEVRKLEIKTYYVASTNRKNIKGEAVYAIYMKNIHQNKQELVEGVSDMLIRADRGEYGEVVGLSLGFTLMSLNAYSLKKKWFVYGGII